MRKLGFALACALVATLGVRRRRAGGQASHGDRLEVGREGLSHEVRRQARAHGRDARDVRATGPGARQAQEPRRLGPRRLRREDQAQGGRLVRLPRQRARRGLRDKGQRLLVQACRFAGRASKARCRCRSSHRRRPARPARRRSSTSSRRRARTSAGCRRSDLDLTEHGDANSIEVVLYGERDAQTLRAGKFRYTVRVADLDKRVRANRRADRRYALARRRPAAAGCRAGSTTLPAPGRLRARAEAAGRAGTRSWCGRSRFRIGPTSDATSSGSRSRPSVRPERRQADLREHRHPPRARVAVGRAHDRVGVRPAHQLRQAARARRAWSGPRATSWSRS